MTHAGLFRLFARALSKRGAVGNGEEKTNNHVGGAKTEIEKGGQDCILTP
jgi:hypothetical protein